MISVLEYNWNMLDFAIRIEVVTLTSAHLMQEQWEESIRC